MFLREAQSLIMIVVLSMVPWVAAAKNMSHAKSASYDATLSGYAYPFPVKTYAFTSQGQQLEMAYMYLPAQANKPTVVLMHGKNFASDYWQKTADLLHQKGYGVLMPDQIGFGKSSKPAHYQFSFEALAANTHALIQKLDIKKPVIMGHSMGGMLASRYALMYPDQVSKLVLVNPIGLEDYLAYVEYKDPSFFYEKELDKTVEGVRSYQQKNYYDGEWSDEYEALIDIHKGWISGPDWPKVAWNNALTYDMIFTGPVVNEFYRLSTPTYLIIGTRDRTGPGRGWKKPNVHHQLGQYQQLGQAAAKSLPDAKLYEIPGVGHLPQFEDFKQYKTDLLDILADDPTVNGHASIVNL